MSSPSDLMTPLFPIRQSHVFHPTSVLDHLHNMHDHLNTACHQKNKSQRLLINLGLLGLRSSVPWQQPQLSTKQLQRLLMKFRLLGLRSSVDAEMASKDHVLESAGMPRLRRIVRRSPRALGRTAKVDRRATTRAGTSCAPPQGRKGGTEGGEGSNGGGKGCQGTCWRAGQVAIRHPAKKLSLFLKGKHQRDSSQFDSNSFLVVDDHDDNSEEYVFIGEWRRVREGLWNDAEAGGIGSEDHEGGEPWVPANVGRAVRGFYHRGAVAGS